MRCKRKSDVTHEKRTRKRANGPGHTVQDTTSEALVLGPDSNSTNLNIERRIYIMFLSIQTNVQILVNHSLLRPLPTPPQYYEALVRRLSL